MAGYDFTNYYKQAYLREKKKNLQLSVQTASKEQSVLEMQQKYERIAGNPVIRLLRGIQKAPAKLKEGKNVKISNVICKEESVSVKQYEKEVQFQKNPYSLWISEHENTVQAKGEEDERKSRTEVVALESCRADFDIKSIEKPFILFVSEEGAKSSRAVWAVENYFDKQPEAAIVCIGEDRLEQAEQGEPIRKNPWFKPAYSPETLLSYFYFGNLFAVRKEALLSLEWLGSSNWKENIYDFILKAEEKLGEDAKTRITSMDEILFHAGNSDKKTLVIDSGAVKGIWGYEKEFEKIKLAALKRRGYEGTMEEGNIPGVYHLCIHTEEKVSVIIPSKDNRNVLEQCIKSIREKTDYTNYEIIVVDNGSFETNRLEIEDLSRTYGFRYICEPMDFNFSAMCNIGVKAANGKYLLLLNDDIEVLEGGYMRRMAGQASVAGVGAVGAKLWYPDSLQIQHAGITNLAIGPAHKLTGMEDDKMYYDGKNYFTCNYLALTGACLMIKKEIYDKLGGLDETMPVAYNDVEFCFRLRKNGYRNVLRNDAVLFHHESLSRGPDDQTKEKAERLLEERKRLYQKYPEYEGWDEYYSPWLLQDSREYGCSGGKSVTEEMTVRPSVMAGLKNAKRLKERQMAVWIERMQTVGSTDGQTGTAGAMRKPVNIGRLEITGWSVLREADNCHYKRSILLEHTEDKKVYAAEAAACLRTDVAQAFPEDVRVELAGLKAWIELKTVEKGTYRIGILYEDMLSDNLYYRMLEKYIEIV